MLNCQLILILVFVVQSMIMNEKINSMDQDIFEILYCSFINNGIYSTNQKEELLLLNMIAIRKVELKCLWNFMKNITTAYFSQAKINCLQIPMKDSVNKEPWFPRTLSDLDLIGKNLMVFDQPQSQNFQQMTDKNYISRRNQIGNLAKEYKMKTPIPLVKYTKIQNNTWQQVYTKLRNIHKFAMCSEFEKNITMLEKQFPMTSEIPQLRHLNDYLLAETGFRIKLAPGIVSSRDFLNAFAFKVFFAGQFIRHHANIDYSPEPDIVHEIVGHIPMFANKTLANFSQKLGLMSLGATEQEIKQIGALYMGTVEFGAMRENKKFVSYGAGISGSAGELNYFMSKEAKFEEFEPIRDCHASFPICRFQPVYKVTNTLQDALQKITEFGKRFNHNYVYDEVAQTIKIKSDPIRY